MNTPQEDYNAKFLAYKKELQELLDNNPYLASLPSEWVEDYSRLRMDKASIALSTFATNLKHKTNHTISQEQDSTLCRMFLINLSLSILLQ